MTTAPTIDGLLVQWGERLFFPPNRIVRSPPPARLDALLRRKAAAIRGRIVATVTRRAPQVMVKVTGGGRGMKAIAAHFRYISKNGRLPIEDDRGAVYAGKESLHDLVDQWRHGGVLIDEEGLRREAFNIMLSMPRGSDPLIVQRAAREFAVAELSGHRYVMVLHDHQAHPHVHISVRASGRDGKRLNPPKADLHRWRETFAERLRGHGIAAEATRQATRGENRRFETLWQLKARNSGRLDVPGPALKSGEAYMTSRIRAAEAWARIAEALQRSDSADDRELARGIISFVRDSPYLREAIGRRQRDMATRQRQEPVREPAPVQRSSRTIEIER